MPQDALAAEDQREDEAERDVGAVVVGGGFIGIETAENLLHRGFEVTIVELGDQILAPLDVEMARIAETYLAPSEN